MHALAEVTSETNYEVIYTVGIKLICVTEFPQIFSNSANGRTHIKDLGHTTYSNIRV